MASLAAYSRCLFSRAQYKYRKLDLGCQNSSISEGSRRLSADLTVPKIWKPRYAYLEPAQLDLPDMLKAALPLVESSIATNSHSVSKPMYMVDMFAGCGGLSLGFENANFVPVFVNELNADAMSTYLRNRKHSLGGLGFSDNADLRCNDANDLRGKRLDQMVADLGNLPELSLEFDQGASV